MTNCREQVRVLYSLELECQKGVNWPKRGPRTELWSSARKASASSRPEIQVSAVLAIVILETNLLCGGEPVNTLARKWKKYMHILFILIYNIFGQLFKIHPPYLFLRGELNKWLLLLIPNSAMLCSDHIPLMIWALLSQTRFVLRIYLVFLITFLVVPLTKASFVSIYQYLINFN